MSTAMAKEAEIERKWFLVDAEGQVLGRLATQVATILRGKHKPIFAPHLDVGDHVVVVNAEKVQLTGRKLTDKMYRWHTGYIGGLREVTRRQDAQDASRARHRVGGAGHAAQEPAGPGHGEEAQGVPRGRPSARRPEARAAPGGRAAVLSRTKEGQDDDMADATTFYGTGRRKTSVARVWLKPGRRHDHASTGAPSRTTSPARRCA